MLITLEMVLGWRACYPLERLAELFATPKTRLEVLTLKDGPWKDVPDNDRIWVMCHAGVFDSETFVRFAKACAAAAATYAADVADAAYAADAARAAYAAATYATYAARAAYAADAARAAAAADAADAATRAAYAAYAAARKVQVEWFINELSK